MKTSTPLSLTKSYGPWSRGRIQSETSKSSGAPGASGWTRWLIVSPSSAFTLRAPSSMPVAPTSTLQVSRRLLSRAPNFGLRCSPSGGTSCAEEKGVRWSRRQQPRPSLDRLSLLDRRLAGCCTRVHSGDAEYEGGALDPDVALLRTMPGLGLPQPGFLLQESMSRAQG